MDKLFSTLEVKSINNDQRIIKGIATTVSPDRVNDTINIDGAMFKLPMPLLKQHDHSQPIGTITSMVKKGNGLELTAQIAKIDEEGTLKDRIDSAWNEIKSGLVRGLSIGFRALDYDVNRAGGIEYTSIEIYEVSAVTVPANADCSITSIKSQAASHAPKKATEHVTVKLNSGGVKLPDLEPSDYHSSLTLSEKQALSRLAYAPYQQQATYLNQKRLLDGREKYEAMKLFIKDLRGEL
ncbi:HK97 family phage prohead protease [Acinetobacter sp. MD2(2019)]|uniref:HK97 family phage prohead protease n=1 Tax=Acinetobacter sp. MD2(2019) TaxID=2605273 RepID=UPI002D1F5490|nr:HK97 family phage prohead protease [Acinetobacter sp. MD2(2019)]MEB3754301.1 HK97 family phage prohead protease [Acinetobacter sp. MD2(2019)]